MVNVILDCDPGIDDALAIAVLVGNRDKLNVKAVLTSAGNQTIEKTYHNARDLLAVMGCSEIPVYRGAEKPLKGQLTTAANIHGARGLGTVELHASSAQEEAMDAVSALKFHLDETDGKTVLVCTGPLTNAALFLSRYPEAKNAIDCIVVMGGSYSGGNTSPTAEFNIYVDPEAAEMVFSSGIPIYMFALDVTEKVRLLPSEIAQLEAVGNETARVLAEALRYRGNNKPLAKVFGGVEPEQGTAEIHDPCTAVYLVNPETFQFTEMNVVVETEGRFTRGTTVMDIHNITGRKPNVHVAVSADKETFWKEILKSVERLK